MFPHEEHLVVALKQTNNNVILLLNDLMALWTTNVILANSSQEEVTRALIRQKMIHKTIEKFPNNNENLSMKSFEPGTVVVFDPSNFNPQYWNNLPEQERIQYYGPLGYGREKLVFFVFLCEIKNAPGHCVLVSLEDQHIETMRHTQDFREVAEEEF